jgi:hypothetical protein
MAAVIGKVSAVFSASTSGLTAGCNRASAALESVSKDVRGVRNSMALMTAMKGAQLFGQVAGAATNTARSLIQMGAAQGEVIDKTSKLAARLGFTYGEFAGLTLAGDLAGVGMETIAAAATKADVAFVKAAGGSKTAIAAFAKIGLSVDKLNGMTASERFDAIANSIAKLPTEAERAAAAVAIFGRSGGQLLPLFAEGASGIAQARAEAERFGLTLSNTQGRDVEGMNDAFTRAAQAIKGIVGQVVAYLAPAINAITTKFSNFVGDVGGATIGQAIGEALLAGAMALASVADYMVTSLGGVFDKSSGVASQWSTVWGIADRVANYLFYWVESARGMFLLAVATLQGVVGDLASAMSSVAGMIPGMSDVADTLDKAAATAKLSSRQSFADATTASNDAVKAFQNAVMGRQAGAEQAAAGPAVQLVQAAQEAARRAAAQKDVGARTTLQQKPAAAAAMADLGPSTSAIKATDSTSKEGIAEMFRIMRGESETVQEEQLGELRGIRAALENQGAGDDFAEAAIAAM